MKRWVLIGVGAVLLAAAVGAGLVLRARGTSGVAVSHVPTSSAVSTNDSDTCPYTPPQASPEYSSPEVSNPALRKLVDRRGGQVDKDHTICSF
jgi:carbonic anhydrase/acetyltransferase-like protein (isoleucine patch superfamily)